jgi:NADPH:quinone reductase-like Zn-dependent oxidoreductase
LKAVVLEAYGSADGLRLKEVDTPTPRADQVLVTVHATTVSMGDTEIRASNMPLLFRLLTRLWLGFFRPRQSLILGMEMAGVVESVGEAVERFSPGDEVFGSSAMGLGAHAESVCVPAQGLLAHKPPSVPFEQAAPLTIGGLAALGYLRQGGVEQARTVLIRGASGSIGTYAVQLAKHFGAHVTAVCGAQAMERMEALGADAVIDYTRQEFDENGQTYDLILDVVGKVPISRCLRSLTPKGSYVRGTVPGLWELMVALWVRLASRKRVVLGDAGGSARDLVFLGQLLTSGALRSVIDRRYPLDQIAQAHRYVETGHKQGHVLIEVVPS